MEASGICFLGVTELPSFPLLQGEWIYISWQLHSFERFLLHAYSVHFLRNTSVMCLVPDQPVSADGLDEVLIIFQRTINLCCSYHMANDGWWSKPKLVIVNDVMNLRFLRIQPERD